MKKLSFFAPLAFGLCAGLSATEDPLDALANALTFSSPDGALHARVSGTANLEFYHGDQSETGFVFSESPSLFVPRLITYLDVQYGKRWYGFAQARVDRGFDPSDAGLEARLDEYALRYAVAPEGRCCVQIGQFASVVGSWSARHDPWDNPFVGAPMLYEHMTGVNQARAATSFSDLTTRDEDIEYEYTPIVWGPAYTSGASIFGKLEKFDYAAEIKNVGPGSVPESWSVTKIGFEEPAYAFRLAYRPSMKWKFGVSYSDSVYLLPEGVSSIPAGFKRRDYRQQLIGQELSFAWRRLQVWAEVYRAEFNVPTLGKVRTTAGYLETRYKFTPQFFGALRWNRQVFSSLTDPATGVARRWGENLWRLDAASVYRFTPHTQLKAQITARPEGEGHSDLVFGYALQATMRF